MRKLGAIIFLALVLAVFIGCKKTDQPENIILFTQRFAGDYKVTGVDYRGAYTSVQPYDSLHETMHITASNDSVILISNLAYRLSLYDTVSSYQFISANITGTETAYFYKSDTDSIFMHYNHTYGGYAGLEASGRRIK
jgi:hypothetical protein